MTEYIATFWTHLAAISTLRTLRNAGVEAAARPVPRMISSSCGTCVRYRADTPCLSMLHRDYQQVAIVENGAYTVVAKNNDAF